MTSTTGRRSRPASVSRYSGRWPPTPSWCSIRPIRMRWRRRCAEHGPGDAGQIPLQLVEAGHAMQHFPDDQQGPAVAEHLGVAKAARIKSAAALGIGLSGSAGGIGSTLLIA